MHDTDLCDTCITYTPYPKLNTVIMNLTCIPQASNTYWVPYYSTGVQIVSCTLSSDSVLSESTGLFNPVLSVSANEIAFDKKLANQSVSFNWC